MVSLAIGGRAGRVRFGTTRRLVRYMAARRVSRLILNKLYECLSLEWQVWVYARFAKLFRGYDGAFEEGKWRLKFCRKSVWIPLRRQFAWLDWDASLSVLGHEPELKRTYSTLIQLQRPPRLVLDIGTNYGTHSIAFLAHGIDTISFEPNPACHPFFRLICAMNGVQCRIEPLALGNSEGVVDLWYPEGEEWLGTTDAGVRERSNRQLARTVVTQTTVDRYVKAHGLSPDVLKIDTEGTDMLVLQGAAETLATCRPVILFESWQASDRGALLSFLDERSYVVSRLPLLGSRPPQVLTAEQFLEDREMNFAGLPSEMIHSWPPGFGESRDR
jgi:FkbM family methyltransferase